MKIRQTREKTFASRMVKLVLCLVISLSAGLIGGIFTSSAITGWYSTLLKPGFNPPNWLFGPVWTILYLMMGLALFLIIDSGERQYKIKSASGIFLLQLVLNLLWSLIFFGLKRPDLAFGEILLLWLAILWTIVSFRKISRQAALLLIPYLAWVTFAALLNFSLWRLNI